MLIGLSGAIKPLEHKTQFMCQLIQCWPQLSSLCGKVLFCFSILSATLNALNPTHILWYRPGQKYVLITQARQIRKALPARQTHYFIAQMFHCESNVLFLLCVIEKNSLESPAFPLSPSCPVLNNFDAMQLSLCISVFQILLPPPAIGPQI